MERGIVSAAQPGPPPAAPNGSQAEPLLDARQAAELLNVPESWVRAEARADRIPHLRLGPKYVRFEAAELVAWWQTRRRGPWRARGTAAAVASGSHPGAPLGDLPANGADRGDCSASATAASTERAA